MNEECVICQELLQTRDTIITLGECRHTFHNLCLQSWAIMKNTCPLCRAPFTEGTDLKRALPTLMAMALWFPIEDQIQRISLGFAFIKHILCYFNTSEDFIRYREIIVAFSERFIITNYKIPLLSYNSRNDLHNQLIHLKRRFNTLIGDENMSLDKHIFVRTWKEQLLQDPRGRALFLEKRLAV
jgi:hypothetical protein